MKHQLLKGLAFGLIASLVVALCDMTKGTVAQLCIFSIFLLIGLFSIVALQKKQRKFFVMRPV